MTGSFIAGQHEAIIGSSDQNAIWEEFGTGEHALQGNGRKGGWSYQDEKGDWHYTTGKKPSRAFFKAYTRYWALFKMVIFNIKNIRIVNKLSIEIRAKKYYNKPVKFSRKTAKGD